MSFAPLGFSFDSPWAVGPMHVLDGLTRLYGSLHPAIVVMVIVQTTFNGCRGVETCVCTETIRFKFNHMVQNDI